MPDRFAKLGRTLRLPAFASLLAYEGSDAAAHFDEAHVFLATRSCDGIGPPARKRPAATASIT